WLNLVKKQSAHRFLRAALISCKLISSCFPDLGSDILSINTEEENNFLLTMFQTKWNGPNEILLGMFYDSDGKGSNLTIRNTFYNSTTMSGFNTLKQDLHSQNSGNCRPSNISGTGV
uniref:CD302 molecule n=1 Tax=Leptobrachium leishanense TaxID=445787 RepID=A0A8C5PYB7_9ANUR